MMKFLNLNLKLIKKKKKYHQIQLKGLHLMNFPRKELLKIQSLGLKQGKKE